MGAASGLTGRIAAFAGPPAASIRTRPKRTIVRREAVISTLLVSRFRRHFRCVSRQITGVVGIF